MHVIVMSAVIGVVGRVPFAFNPWRAAHGGCKAPPRRSGFVCDQLNLVLVAAARLMNINLLKSQNVGIELAYRVAKCVIVEYGRWTDRAAVGIKGGAQGRGVGAHDGHSVQKIKRGQPKAV